MQIVSLGRWDDAIAELRGAQAQYLGTFFLQVFAACMIGFVTFHMIQDGVRINLAALTGQWPEKLLTLIGSGGMIGSGNLAFKTLRKLVIVNQRLARSLNCREQASYFLSMLDRVDEKIYVREQLERISAEFPLLYERSRELEAERLGG